MRSPGDARDATVPQERSDAELMAQMRASEGDACGALFERYARLVYRVALDILHDPAEAEDVTQDVFLEIYRKAHLYNPARGSVRVWFLQYAYHRTLGRKTALSRRAAYRGEVLDEDAPAAAVRRGLTPEECGWVIRAGFAELSSQQRATLELACFEDLSLRDVAARLGVTVGCARHYYYRGLARLQAWARTAVSQHAGGGPQTGRSPVPSRRTRSNTRPVVPPGHTPSALLPATPATAVRANGLLV
jgi:RNA polymerase sigma-70 factor (ECF subfamily)